LTFSKASKTIANTSYEGTYLNLDSSFGQHQVKIVAIHNKQKFEILLPVVLQQVSLATLVQKPIKILKPNYEVLNFAQSKVLGRFHYYEVLNFAQSKVLGRFH
jgi:hypothetical protein